MARLFIDGFCSGDASLWDFCYSSITFPADRGGFGPYCAYLNGSLAQLYKNFGSKTAIYAKFRMEIKTGSASAKTLSLHASSSQIACLAFPTDSPIGFYTGTSEWVSSDTLRASSVNNLVANRVYLVEFYYLPRTDSSGGFALRIDGQPEINWTGITSASGTSVDTICLGNNQAASSHQMYFGEVVIDDSNWIGNTRIGYRLINGAGNYAQFTGVPGANYANVDEVPANDLDFNWVNSVDQIDSFTLDSLQTGSYGGVANSIKSVAVQVRHKYTGSPTPTKMRPFLRIGGTDSPGTAVACPTTPISSQSIWEVRPDNSQPFATTDDPEIGYKSAA